LKKTNFSYTYFLVVVLFVVACSPKKNTFLSRNSHALSTKYNILYNGNIALDKGVEDLKLQYNDNFWEVLPVERMQIKELKFLPGTNKNSDFERAEEKATKAIQKHSMNIDGAEKNPQMDEAHLLLGKARYYDQRFVPALEAFNYVLYKYPNSDKIYEVKIWREKTNMRLDNNELAIDNLNKLLKEIKFKDQVFSDANATLAQAFLNNKEKDSAVAKLKLATKFTKQNEEKARYRFILGQIYNDLGYKDSAFASFQKIIEMKRKATRNYTIQAHAQQASFFDYKNGDTLAFVKKYKTLLKDRENRPYLDVINHQFAIFYDKQQNNKNAIKYYNESLRNRKQDEYLVASNYRNLALINFNEARYAKAGMYYDSTLVSLNPRTREFKSIEKKRKNLEDVIKYETIAQTNDSILKVANMSFADRDSYYQTYIDKLKIADEIKRKEEEKAAKIAAQKAALQDVSNNLSQSGITASDNAFNSASKSNAPNPAPLNTSIASSSGSTFYFYNTSTVAYGKLQFKKKYGNRELQENWRYKDLAKSNTKNTTDNANDIAQEKGKEEINPLYTAEFYTANIPNDPKILDSLATERNFAYYQLGVIYKEKFKEYERAAEKLEKLLVSKPEERLVLPAMYNLYKIYEIINKPKALAIKNQIIQQFPDSRYAQIITNPNSSEATASSPEVAYDLLYKDFENQKYRELNTTIDLAIEQYTGEDIVSKMELLKASVIGKLKGLEDYKTALNFVALTYPNSEEGKSSEKFISEKIPYLESLTFNSDVPKSWKILYKFDDLNSKSNKALQAKIEKFAKERTVDKLYTSIDLYTFTENILVIHGIRTKEDAIGIAQVLKEFKDYKIAEIAYPIATENYTVVQIKKKFDVYVSENWLQKEINPVDKNITISKEEINAPKTISPQEMDAAIKKQEANNKNNNKQQSLNNINSPDLPNKQNSNGNNMPNMMPPSLPSPKK
jgi:tetratricopeptide (TPR) repeat protein